MTEHGNDAVVAPLPPTHPHNLRNTVDRDLRDKGTSYKEVQEQAKTPCTMGPCTMAKAPMAPPYHGPKLLNARMSTFAGRRRRETPPVMVAAVCGMNVPCSDEHHAHLSPFRLQSVAVTNIAQGIMNPGAPFFAYDYDDPPVRSRKQAKPTQVIREL